jgi:hypothetical protein
LELYAHKEVVMGVENRNTRLPRIIGNISRWKEDGVEVSYDRRSDTATIEYLGKYFSIPQKQAHWFAEMLLNESDIYRHMEIEIPRRKVKWLAEVLLQVSDLHRITHTEPGRDDYNRPDLSPATRR